jgi:HK97 family phage major capsid protein
LKNLNAVNKKFIEKYDDKLTELSSGLLELQKKANRIGAPGTVGESRLVESKADLAAFIRSRGDVKGMFSASGPSGGWSVAPVLQDGIGTIVRDNSVLRSLVDFIQIDAGDAFEELISVTAAGATWTGEKSARPETTSPQLAKITTPLLELYASPVLTQRLADDSGTNMVSFLVSETGISFSEAEELALFSGTGVIDPRGLDSITTAATADATRPFFTIQHIATGTSGAFDTAAPLDSIKKVFYSLKAGYRKNSKWVCSSATALEISKLKDADGKGLWDEGSIQSGQPQTLFGQPVIVCETCPAIASDSKSLYLADWNQAMRGIERAGNKLLLDTYSDKPNLIVYVYRRVGFGLRNSNAIKCLKFSTT